MKYYRTTSHSKYDMKVHLVFVPKYRNPFLYGQIGESVRDIIKQICTELEVEIINGKIAKDHIHMFVSYPPHLSISKMMQKIKGKSSYKLLQLYPQLKRVFWGRHVWARGYCAVSTGNITDEIIQKYIEEQEGEDLKHGEIEME